MRLLTILSLSILLSGLSAHLLTSDDCKSVLSAHNTQRTSWGCKSLEWDDDLANSASTWAENCECKTSSEDKCGQNVAFTSMTNNQFPSCEWQVTNQWCESEKDWNCETNTCSGGASVCDSFTQIIWKNSSKVGCGVSTCPSGTIDASNEVQFLVCFYDVLGNQENIHPLTCTEEKPTSCTSTPKPAHAVPPPHVTPPPPKAAPPKKSPPPPPKEASPPPKPKPTPPPKEASPPPKPKATPPPKEGTSYNAPKESSPPPHQSSPPPHQSSPPPHQSSPPPHQSSPPPKESSPPPHQSSPPPKESSPPPHQASAPPPPKQESNPPPQQSSGSHYAALSDAETSLENSSSLSLGTWIGICVGSSALTALIVGLIAFFVAKRGSNAERA